MNPYFYSLGMLITGAADKPYLTVMDVLADAIANEEVDAVPRGSWVRRKLEAERRSTPSHERASDWDVRGWWKAAQESGGAISHEDGWTLISTEKLNSLQSANGERAPSLPLHEIEELCINYGAPRALVAAIRMMRDAHRSTESRSIGGKNG